MTLECINFKKTSQFWGIKEGVWTYLKAHNKNQLSNPIGMRFADNLTQHHHKHNSEYFLLEGWQNNTLSENHVWSRLSKRVKELSKDPHKLTASTRHLSPWHSLQTSKCILYAKIKSYLLKVNYKI